MPKSTLTFTVEQSFIRTKAKTSHNLYWRSLWILEIGLKWQTQIADFMAARKNGGPSKLEAKPPIRAVPNFFEFFSFFSSFSCKTQLFIPITSTLLPTLKFEIIISNPRNDFYTLLQNLNKNGQKRTRKINFGYKIWTLSQET